MISANDIRQAFLDYFRKNDHAIVSSSSLVPREDPSLLFTNAGMVQFKKVFLGQEQRDYKRATTSQKCLRVGGKHNDLENVGFTARHHTFFEMLGNFSFGDYFKEQAIGFAWEFLTKEMALPKDRLYATVYKDDDEAIGLWKKVAALPENRIYRLGDKDNFWSMGDTGPCGPCSEILIDQGEHMRCGPDCGIGSCDCDRYLEIWNLVFMQFDQIEPGKRLALPRPSIDTGMGLERVTAVCQGVYSNYDSDLFQDIIGHAAGLAGVPYRALEETGAAYRVIADHSRAIAFMIADGILPSNEGRGYVLRRLIRRAFRFGRLVGLRDPFLFRTAEKVAQCMGQAFPELNANPAFMLRVVREEEERFSQTLDKGLHLLEEEMTQERGQRISGDFAFKLYDTFGFPLDIVNDVAGKKGWSVDEKGFNQRMAEQKERAKAAWKGSGSVDPGARFKRLLEEGLSSEFVGYETLSAVTRVTALLGESGQPVETLRQGEQGYLAASVTPFYGESGGQLGDSGLCRTPSGAAEVKDSHKPSPNLTVHAITVCEGELSLDQEVELRVQEGPRLATARNHTATHLLHAALRRVLGEHVKQAGSLVGPDRLRFDFQHIAALTDEEILRVEDLVNQAVLDDQPVTTSVMDYPSAVARGAMALFGEKYADLVRVVEVPGVSVELCGGTHLRAAGQIGPFLLLSEAGVAAGVRRIEAATGFNALGLIREQRRELFSVARTLKTQVGEAGELTERVKGLQTEIRTLNKDMEKLAAKAASSAGTDIMAGVEEIGGVKTLIKKVDAPNVKILREQMDQVRSKLPSGVAALASAREDRVDLLVYVSKDLHSRFTAPELIKDVAALVGGSGGGRPDLAQAGGTEPGGLDAAFAKLREKLAG